MMTDREAFGLSRKFNSGNSVCYNDRQYNLTDFPLREALYSDYIVKRKDEENTDKL